MAEKPEGADKRFGDRLKIEHINASKSIEDIFERSNIDILYQMEKELIEKHIESEIKNNKSICNPDSTERKQLLQEIKQKYAEKIKESDEKLLEEAESGLFKEKFYPSSKKYIAMFIFAFIVILETALLIFIGMAQGGGFNPIILMYGVFLFFGSLLLGFVGGQLHYKNELGKLEKYDKKKDSINSSWFVSELIGGLVLILFVAVMRAYGAGSPGEMAAAFSLTVILSMAATLFEARADFMGRMRKWAIDNQVLALQIYATKKHIQAIENGIYENFIERFCQKYKQDKDYQKEDNV